MTESKTPLEPDEDDAELEAGDAPAPVPAPEPVPLDNVGLAQRLQHMAYNAWDLLRNDAEEDAGKVLADLEAEVKALRAKLGGA